MHLVCILIYMSMYLYSYLSTHGISELAAHGDCQQLEVCLKITIEWTSTTVTPLSTYTCRCSSMVYWEASIERVVICPWMFRSSELGDALGGLNRVKSVMHLEARIEWTQRFTPRPWSSGFGDALGRRDWLNSEMHSLLWSSEFRDAHAAGYDRGRLEESLEVVDRQAGDRRRARCWDSIHRLVNSKL